MFQFSVIDPTQNSAVHETFSLASFEFRFHHDEANLGGQFLHWKNLITEEEEYGMELYNSGGKYRLAFFFFTNI